MREPRSGEHESRTRVATRHGGRKKRQENGREKQMRGQGHHVAHFFVCGQLDEISV